MSGIQPNGDMRYGFELTLIEMVGDWGAKTQNKLVAFGGYNALAWRLTNALETGSLILTNSYWDAFSNVMTTFLGVAMGERPSNLQWLGVGLISGGILLLGKK